MFCSVKSIEIVHRTSLRINKLEEVVFENKLINFVKTIKTCSITKKKKLLLKCLYALSLQ